MRFLVKARLPLDTRKPLSGQMSLRQAMSEVLDATRVEALFFGEEEGKHCVFLVVNAKDAHQMPALTGPLRRILNAEVEYMPAADANSKSFPTSRRAAS